MKAAFLVLTMISTVAFAQSPAPTIFAAPNAVTLETFPKPPAPGSDVDKNDFVILMGFQKTRTKADCAAAESQAALDLRSLFGATLTQKEMGAISELYFAVFNDTDYFVNEIKSHYNRPRPFLRDAHIRLCIESHPSTSYPSGHSAISRSVARTLALVFPERAAVFLKAANQAAMNRVLGGVHHPSDIRAGQLLGDEVFASMMKNPKFAQAVRAAQATARGQAQ